MSDNISRKRFLLRGSSLLPLFLVALSFTIAGCPGKKATSPGKSTTDSTTPSPANSAGLSPEKLLESVYEKYQPANLGISTQIESACSSLDNWLQTLKKRETVSLSFSERDKKTMLELIDRKTFEGLEKERFVHDDIRHLRNSVIYRSVARNIIDKKATTIENCTKLFYYTIQNIELLEEGVEPVPFPPFRFLLWGKGTREDRARLFASLVKELDVDVVVVKPKTSSRETMPLLLGLIVGAPEHSGNVYLYDPQMGIPLPSSEDSTGSVLVEKPATLAEFSKDNNVFDRLKAASFEYGFRPEELKAIRFELVSESASWSKRMKIMQNSLSAKQSLKIYDPISESDTGSGTIDRIGKAQIANWNPEDFSIWKYPREISRKLEQSKTDRNLQQRMNDIIRTFSAPVGTDRRSDHFRSRVAQLLGNNETAIIGYIGLRNYVTLQINSQGGVTKDAEMTINVLAKDEAELWSGLIQLERGFDEDARNELEAYRRTHLAGGGRYVQGLYLLGYAQMKLGDHAAAIQTMTRLPDIHPQAHGFQWLLKRWRAIRDASRKK